MPRFACKVASCSLLPRTLRFCWLRFWFRCPEIWSSNLEGEDNLCRFEGYLQVFLWELVKKSFHQALEVAWFHEVPRMSCAPATSWAWRRWPWPVPQAASMWIMARFQRSMSTHATIGLPPSSWERNRIGTVPWHHMIKLIVFRGMRNM